MDFQHSLLRSGLLNVTAPSYSEIASSPNRDTQAIRCFSFHCSGRIDTGVHVHIGPEAPSKCPECGSKQIRYETIAAHRVDDLRAKMEDRKRRIVKAKYA